MNIESELKKEGIEVTVLRLMTISPLPTAQILDQATKNIYVFEDAMQPCGIARSLAWELRNINESICVRSVDLGSDFVPHGSVEQLQKQYGLDAQSIAQMIKEAHYNEN